MKAVFEPSVLKGTIKAPPSKSDSHRAIICACLSEGKSVISNLDFSDDICATVDCMRALGAEAEISGNRLTVNMGIKECDYAELNCRESGSTLRFLIPLASVFCKRCRFTGSSRLFERPLSVYESIFKKSGTDWSADNNSLYLSGALRPGCFEIPGNISSQFITGLLFALPLLNDNSRIVITPPFESRPYIDLTLSRLDDYGISAMFPEPDTIDIYGNQRYTAACTSIEGDWSNSAFFEAFNLTGGYVNVTDLNELSLQGDKIYREFFKQLSGTGSVIDLSDCPDLGPVCFALAHINGAVFTGTERLKYKESDRCAAMAQELKKFGIRCENRDESFTVYPSLLRRPAEPLNSHNDHRIVMALSVLCSSVGGEIQGAEAVRKSLPGYFEMIESLGAEVKLYETD
ncbi:MAG: 3-phosphoshikimate 1-carboxyvinyltransferase [Clostridia bacterium]|nr:3-phosphoshikimate 1-carboxyvinyltransferase [Clostridia bacterium]